MPWTLHATATEQSHLKILCIENNHLEFKSPEKK